MNQQNDQHNQKPEQQSRMNPNQQQIKGQQPEPQAMNKKAQQPDVKEGESDENFEKQAQTERPQSNPKEFVRKDGKNQVQQPDRSDRLN